MDYNVIVIRYGEMNTKGKNKKDFINTLARSIKEALIDYKDKIEYKVCHDHIYLYLSENNLEIIDILKEVSGLYSFSLCKKIDPDIDNIISESLDILKNEEGKTFKVYTRRIDKSYPYISDEINRMIAKEVLKNTSKTVDVHYPDTLLSIEIRSDGAYLFTKTIKGLGGYPKGTLGKGLMMLSGGIDSPVASYLLLKRGVALSFIHFSSPPYTNSGVIEKLVDILTELKKYQTKNVLYIVPFTKIQEKIYEVSEVGYQVTIMRRMMYRIATLLARKKHMLILANGESIGQVASQTLESIDVINKVTDMSVIRPLATYDKEENIKIAKSINTYDISIRPFEDCCTIFPIKNPKTQPHEDVIKLIESRMDIEALIKECLENIEIKVIK